MASVLRAHKNWRSRSVRAYFVAFRSRLRSNDWTPFRSALRAPFRSVQSPQCSGTPFKGAPIRKSLAMAIIQSSCFQCNPNCSNLIMINNPIGNHLESLRRSFAMVWNTWEGKIGLYPYFYTYPSNRQLSLSYLSWGAELRGFSLSIKPYMFK